MKNASDGIISTLDMTKKKSVSLKMSVETS